MKILVEICRTGTAVVVFRDMVDYQLVSQAFQDSASTNCSPAGFDLSKEELNVLSMIN
jgi:hypothetical protein